jgi:hypothetical protein
MVRVLVHVLGRNLGVRMDSESETVWTSDAMQCNSNRTAMLDPLLLLRYRLPSAGVNSK